VIYVRADLGGCYRRDASSGRLVQLMNWMPVEQSNFHGVVSLALDPVDPRTVYIAAGKHPDNTLTLMPSARLRWLPSEPPSR
jgi:hypothetical protein